MRGKKQNKNKIAVIGTGYVGLVTGACFTNLGYRVICIDKNKEKIEKLKKGIIPIYESGLEEMVKRNVKQGRLFFSADLGRSIQNAAIIFICVGTPSAKNGKPDLSYIKAVVQEIGRNIREPKIIVTKSTVSIGTGKNLVAKIISKYWKGNFEVVSNPEFLREGTAISDFLNPDRIVIGVNSPKAGKAMLELYKKIDCPKIVTTLESAEMIKYASNTFLANKISFINEIANICEKSGADVEEVARGMGLDKRIGPKFLNAGIGYGGSCFPKDVRGLNSIARKYKYNFKILKAVTSVNENQQKNFAAKIKNILKETKGNTVGVWGLSFKPNTDDVRKSPALEIIKILQKSKYKIQTYDPVAVKNAKKELSSKNIKFCKTALDAIKNVDVLALVTDWPEFSDIDMSKVKKLMRHYYILDGRNLLDPTKMKKLGFRYIGVGRNIKII